MSMIVVHRCKDRIILLYTNLWNINLKIRFKFADINVDKMWRNNNLQKLFRQWYRWKNRLNVNCITARFDYLTAYRGGTTPALKFLESLDVRLQHFYQMSNSIRRHEIKDWHISSSLQITDQNLKKSYLRKCKS